MSLEDEATFMGLTLMSDMKDYKINNRFYKFNTCGHISNLSIRYVRKNKVKCWQCVEDNYSLCAKEFGATLITSNKECKANERTLILRCGCTKNIRADVLTLGYVTCTVHDDYYYNQPSSIYLVKITQDYFSWLKLGYAKVTDKRVKNYGLTNESQIEIIKVIPISTGKEAFEIERSIHSKFNSKRIDPEIMKNYHEKSGFTECYPLDMLNDLLGALII